MIDRVKMAWDWFVTGLVDALLSILDRLRPAASYRLIVRDQEAAIGTPDGRDHGRLSVINGEVVAEPADMARRLGDAKIDILVPANWLFSRNLDPVSVQSLPFLDAFVRHHIERITPWRVADLHYRIKQEPLTGDPERLAIAVCVVPRRLVDPWTTALERLKPRRMRILSQANAGDDALAIPLLRAPAQGQTGARENVLVGLSIIAVAFIGALGWLWWENSLVQADLAEQDRVIEDRKSVLARARRQDQGSQDLDAKLLEVRREHFRAVDIIDNLAAALPDSAHLTGVTLQKSQLTIIGVSTDSSRLVPALEQSGRFADVAFGAATTKIETGGGDRFQLDMRISDARQAAP